MERPVTLRSGIRVVKTFRFKGEKSAPVLILYHAAAPRSRSRSTLRARRLSGASRYTFFKHIPVVDAGLELGEAINSCTGRTR